LARIHASKKERLASGGFWLGNNILENYVTKENDQKIRKIGFLRIINAGERGKTKMKKYLLKYRKTFLIT